MQRLLTLSALIIFSVALPTGVEAQSRGEALYTARCATCHDNGNGRTPSRQTLQAMTPSRIRRALDFGAMVTIASQLTRDEREAVARFLGKPGPEPRPRESAYCKDRKAAVGDVSKDAWNGWSPSRDNARFVAAPLAKLSAASVPRLKLKWSFAFDGDVMAVAQPTVIGNQMFVGSAGGVVHALRADTGCLQWTFQADGPVRSAIVVVPFGRGHRLLFGDLTGWFYALDAATGTKVWKVRPDEHEALRLSAAPVVHNGLVIVPASSWEEARSVSDEYRCCTFRGSLTALRVSDGSVAWKRFMVPPAQPTGKTTAGVETFGPSGIGIWASPTLDLKRNRLYVATGNNYSKPATSLSDSIVALDPGTGAIIWSRQALPNDVYNSACAQTPKAAGCPEGNGPDYDFGSPAILVTTAEGRDLLLAGQKAGIVWAFDPDADGKVVWQTRVGKGGINGGVQWGMASDGQFVYAASSDAVATRIGTTRTYDPAQGGGLTALRIADGSIAWQATPPPCPSRPNCSPAQSAALTAIPGVVFSGSLDGFLRAYSTADGKVIWSFDTVREYETVNGVLARGGSIDGAGPVVVNGMVFVNSGYMRFGGAPGNVLLAFAPE